MVCRDMPRRCAGESLRRPMVGQKQTGVPWEAASPPGSDPRMLAASISILGDHRRRRDGGDGHRDRSFQLSASRWRISPHALRERGSWLAVQTQNLPDILHAGTHRCAELRTFCFDGNVTVDVRQDAKNSGAGPSGASNADVARSWGPEVEEGAPRPGKRARRESEGDEIGRKEGLQNVGLVTWPGAFLLVEYLLRRDCNPGPVAAIALLRA